MLKDLKGSERLLLLKFVCAFAWADLEIQPSERAFVHKLVKKLHLDAEERARVDEWLRVPPKPEEIDPNSVPRAHKELFLKTAEQMISADGVIDPAEKENLELLQMLVR